MHETPPWSYLDLELCNFEDVTDFVNMSIGDFFNETHWTWNRLSY